MSDIDVKKQSSTQGSGQSSEVQARTGQRQEPGRGVSQWERDPLGSWSPTDFYSNPFAMMRRMSEEMDRAFGQFLGQSWSGQSSGSRGASWYPAIEVNEGDGQLQVHAELPGLKPEDVKVEITNNSLIIHGERKYEHEHNIGRAHRSERRYGAFYREVALPEGANAEQAKAQFRNGVLEITVPMPQQASRRREIPVSGETVSAGHSGATTSQEGTSKAAAAGSSTRK